MKKTALVLAIILFLNCSLQMFVHAEERNPSYKEGEILLVCNDLFVLEDDTMKMTELASVSEGKIFLIQGIQSESMEESLHQFQEKDGVIYATPNYILELGLSEGITSTNCEEVAFEDVYENEKLPLNVIKQLEQGTEEEWNLIDISNKSNTTSFARLIAGLEYCFQRNESKYCLNLKDFDSIDVLLQQQNLDSTIFLYEVKKILDTGATFLCSVDKFLPEEMTVEHASALPFTDVSVKDWYYSNVSYVYEKGLMTGYSQNTFGPLYSISRAQLATILYRMDQEPNCKYNNEFSDVRSNDWYADSVAWAFSKKVITGYGNTGLFYGNKAISREELATMLYRYASLYVEQEPSQNAEIINQFHDGNKVSSFAIDAVTWAVTNKIIQGSYEGTILNPHGVATRAECATMIERFCQYLESNHVTIEKELWVDVRNVTVQTGNDYKCTLKADVKTNDKGVQYRWLNYSLETKTWSECKGWSTDKTISWTAPKGGSYLVGVEAKTQTGETDSYYVGCALRKYQNPSQYYQIQNTINIGNADYNVGYGFEGLKVMYVMRKLGVGYGIGMYGAFYDDRCILAVKGFQSRAGLPVTGIVDYNTWIKMGLSHNDWYKLGAYVSPMLVDENSSRKDHIEAMISTAYKYLGTPYVIGASGAPGTGIDCSGLVMQGLFAAGIDMSPINPIRHAYPGYEYESRNIWASSRFLHVDYSQRQRGDLIFYESANGVVIHVAIYLGNDQVIESWPNEVVVWPIIHPQRSRIKGVVRPFV